MTDELSERLPLLRKNQNKTTNNPFVYGGRQIHSSRYEQIKITLVALTLFLPLCRLVLLSLCTILIYLCAFFGTLGHNDEEVRFNRFRQCCIYPIRWLIRLVLFILGFYWIDVKYPDQVKTDQEQEVAPIIVSNHVTFIDGIFFAAHCFPCVAMKSDLRNIPFIGTIMRSLQPIFVDRKSVGGRKIAMEKFITRPSISGSNGVFPPLLIFPEGTTTNQSTLTRFKKGAFMSGSPVQPVVLRYPFKHFDLSWPPTVSAVYLAARLLCQFRMQLEVEYLPIYHPDESEVVNAELYAENVRHILATNMEAKPSVDLSNGGLNHSEISLSNHAFEDVILLLQIQNPDYAQLNVFEHTNVEEIRKLTSLNMSEIEKLIYHFHEKDTNKDGFINIEEMREILHLDPSHESDLTESIFELLDADGNGQVDFREFCFGLSVISSNFDKKEMSRFAFNLYDLDRNGYITRDELRLVLGISRRFSGTKTPKSEVDALINSFDTDRDNQISFEEFQKMVEERPDILAKALAKLETLRGSCSTST